MPTKKEVKAYFKDAKEIFSSYDNSKADYSTRKERGLHKWQGDWWCDVESETKVRKTSNHHGSCVLSLTRASAVWDAETGYSETLSFIPKTKLRHKLLDEIEAMKEAYTDYEKDIETLVKEEDFEGAAVRRSYREQLALTIKGLEKLV